MKLEAAELYRKSNHNTEAAKLLAEIAEDLCSKDVRGWIMSYWLIF
jgi:WD repeat-containing protein 35